MTLLAVVGQPVVHVQQDSMACCIQIVAPSVATAQSQGVPRAHKPLEVHCLTAYVTFGWKEVAGPDQTKFAELCYFYRDRSRVSIFEYIWSHHYALISNLLCISLCCESSQNCVWSHRSLYNSAFILQDPGWSSGIPAERWIISLEYLLSYCHR